MPPDPWDEPSAGGFLMGHFFGWHFVGEGSSSRERWVPMLGFNSWGLENPNTSVIEIKVTEKEQDMW
jgi:hypothetical protein